MGCTENRGTNFYIQSWNNKSHSSKNAYATRHNPCFQVLQLSQLTVVLRNPHCDLTLIVVDTNRGLTFELYSQTERNMGDFIICAYSFLTTVTFFCCNHKVRNTIDATKKNVIQFICTSPSYSVLWCLVLRNRLNKQTYNQFAQAVEMEVQMITTSQQE